MSALNLTFADSQAAADAMGLQIRKPKNDELFLDIDSEADMDVFLKHYQTIPDIVKTYTVTPSKSGGARKHVVVKLNRNVKSLTERVLLQAVLGSDRMRELLSWRRIELGNRDCTLFFEKP